jgi:hypothetical protein
MVRAICLLLIILWQLKIAAFAYEVPSKLPPSQLGTNTLPQEILGNLNEQIKNIAFNETPVVKAIKELAQRAKLKVIFDREDLGTVTGSLSNTTAIDTLLFIKSQANLKCKILDDDTIFFCKNIINDDITFLNKDGFFNSQPAVTMNGNKELQNNNPFLSDSVQDASSTNNSSPIIKASVNKIYLQGQIEHSEQLSPLDPSLRVGASFDETKLKQLTPNNRWFKIPDWLAGTWYWKTNNVTTYSVHNYVTGLKDFDIYTTTWYHDRKDGGWGDQKDRTGQIWNCLSTPCFDQGYTDMVMSFGYMKDYDCLESSKEKVVIRFISTDIRVSRKTGKIISVDQEEQTQTYTPAGPNIRQVTISTKIFDQDGRPLKLIEGFTFNSRIKEFIPTSNLLPLFIEYLESHGLVHLIPEAKTVRVK